MTASFPITAIRWIVGCVFLYVGLLKWVVHDFREGFEKIGIFYPEYVVLIVGGLEWICGSLLLFNLWVRKATLPLMVIMAFAIILTKLPILSQALWKFLFEAKLDFIMLGLLFVLWKEAKQDEK